ncbi:MAG: CocE/NonD family hydrolase [Actinomycetota bacterium]
MSGTEVTPKQAWGGWKPRPATYGIAVQHDVMVKMSDGTKLDVDVYRPASKDGSPAPGKFPVIHTQTPYNKNSGTLAFQAPYLIQRGYAQVIADVRGTGSSEGEWDSFGAREQKDGYELAKWAVDHSWSNGKLALYGTSYGAINQLLTAAQHPPGLKAAFPIVPMSDAYRDISGSGGQVNTSFIPSWLGLVTALGLLPAQYGATDPQEAGNVLADHIKGATDFQVAAASNALEGGSDAYDGNFYRLRSPIEVINKVNVPTFITGGWFDLFQRGEPLLFQSLRANGVPTKLLMGPWYHITAGNGLPADGVPNTDQLSLRWFDHYVKGVPDPGLANVPDVTYYLNGDGHYHMAPSWPPPGVHFHQEYLSGPASPGVPGTLTSKAPADQSPDVIPWQPVSGGCSRSSVQWSAGAGAGSPCETDNEANDASGLAYDLKLPDTTKVTGPLSARLFVSTTASDAQLTARVEDVDANGRATQLSAGWCVMSLRALDHSKSEVEHGLIVRPYHPFTKASALPVKSGQVYEVWVEIFPTAASFAKGHSLRVSIQPSDAPHLTAPLPQMQNEAGGVLSIYHDAKHPSELIVPVSKQ